MTKADTSHSDPNSERSSTVQRIRTLGARATPARVAVLRLLERAPRALSHHDVELALAESGFDRVTLYRVLDWLLESGLAHRVTDADRVFRFSVAATSARVHTDHAHFRCEECGRIFCLEDVAVSLPALPKGFHSRAVELSVSGRCAECQQAVREH